jgi:hypothetical protein
MAFFYSCTGTVAIQQLVAVAGLASQFCTKTPRMNVLAINGYIDNIVLWNNKNTRPMFDTTQGRTENLNDVFSGTLGAWTWDFPTPPSSRDVRMVAVGAFAGNSMEQLLIGKLDHRWTSTAADVQTYGINETADTSSFILSRW